VPGPIEIVLSDSAGGWLAQVTIRDRSTTTHRVKISRAEHERYGDGDVADLVRRSFDFLLEREPNTSILREFDLSAIERYFPEYPEAIARR